MTTKKRCLTNNAFSLKKNFKENTSAKPTSAANFKNYVQRGNFNIQLHDGKNFSTLFSKEIHPLIWPPTQLSKFAGYCLFSPTQL